MRYFLQETLQVPGVPRGWGNGYVVLDKGHPMYGKDDDEINKHVSIHGGITCTVKVIEAMLHPERWPQLTKHDLDKWVVGFDTSHSGDTLKKWPNYRVLNETEWLYNQLASMPNINIEDIKIVELK